MLGVSPHAMGKWHGVGMVLGQVAFQTLSCASVRELWLLRGMSTH